MRLRQHCSLPWAWTAGCDPAEPTFCHGDMLEERVELLLRHGEALISAVDGGTTVGKARSFRAELTGALTCNILNIRILQSREAADDGN